MSEEIPASSSEAEEAATTVAARRRAGVGRQDVKLPTEANQVTFQEPLESESYYMYSCSQSIAIIQN